ncbi:MAG TPA: LuxR C-terminal-related transcriptional regulator [Nocardioides sp.]|nr:LuxR C-terminal-related transcriptional regulator [Nocardioides sp.]
MVAPAGRAKADVSEREAEVLALVGEHLTNAQIASRLYLSVRTVESHVSSLLRKLGVADRRGLAELAGARPDTRRIGAPAPAVLTSFVGREAERAALAEALSEYRLVTAVGPGGVGKTRLAVAVADDVAGRYSGGAGYVDLCPVTDPAMVGAAVASAFGFGEQPGRSPLDTVIAKLADADVLLVVDNCEHLLDGVSGVVERLLAGCPRVVVLTTSRARLRVPFEFVFPVPGMSLERDAMALFRERASMTGWTTSYSHDHLRIRTICGRLDGMALAIELAAARVATLGLDGLDRELSDPLRLLTGGSRMDERHRSLRAVLDWSFGLLTADEQAALRRSSVFASRFTVEAVADVAGFAPLTTTSVASVLATLAEHQLLEVVDSLAGTRYGMLETIRQYGAELMERDGEQDAVMARHLRWCLGVATRLEPGGAAEGFDEVADDLRAALRWSSGREAWRAEAHQLAVRVAELTYARGRPSEAQERYEEAAALAEDPAEAAEAFHLAAAVAWGRHVGNEAIRLLRAAADAARRGGDPARAALELITAAELVTNAPGIMSELSPPGEDRALLGEALALAAGDVHVEAAVLTVTTAADESDPAYADLAERAVELAHRLGDARLESHALDQLTAAHLICGDTDAAVATVRRRIDLLAPLAHDAEMAWEHSDTLHMAPLVSLAAGDLGAARRYAQERAGLPFFREADHLAVEWLLPTAAIAGDFEEADVLAQRFRRGWTEAGRPPLGGIAFAPAAAAMAYGIRGDDEARREWLQIADDMHRVVNPTRGRQTIYRPAFDGMVALHHGEVDVALRHVAGEPESFKPWHDAAWRPWYTAVWAEAGVLAALPDRRERLDRARFVVRANPIAAAIVERAAALDAGDQQTLLAVAADLDAAGCPYQRARTLILAGGEARGQGEAIMANIGASAMVLV